MLAVALASPLLGLDNFAVSVALALQGMPPRTRILIVVLFAGMASLAIVLGAALGTASASWLGPYAQYLGGTILVALGAHQLWRDRHATARAKPIAMSLRSLLLVACGVSLDTAVAGIAFGLRADPVVASALIVGSVTAALSLAGLELGAQVRDRRPLPAPLAPAVLVGIGVAMAAGVL